jgi:cell division protein FtsQ
MKLRWDNISLLVKSVGLVVLLTVSISFVDKKYNAKTVTTIDININNEYKNYFINEKDVLRTITDDGQNKIIGMLFSELNLDKIEDEIRKNHFVEDVEVYKELNGSLSVNIYQSKPIARLVSNQMQDRYISDKGKILPVSRRYTARVILIDGPYADNKKLTNLFDSETGAQLMELLEFIENSTFWKAQIAQLHIDASGNIKMYQQVGKQVIDFGKPEMIESKFRKIEIFYEEIMPTKGWNTYNRVSVKFKNQIVCE